MKQSILRLFPALIFIILLIALALYGQITINNPPLVMQNAGTPIGAAAILNCGSNTNCSNAAGVVTLTATGITSISEAPPYLVIGGTKFVQWDGVTAAIPTAPTYLNSVACSSATTGTNGDLVLQNTTNINCWGGYTATTSVEGDFAYQTASSTNSPTLGIWLWDSANGVIFAGGVTVTAATATCAYTLSKYTYAGTGNPVSSTTTTFGMCNNPTHLKLVTVGTGHILFEVSPNGGQTFVGLSLALDAGFTISQGGFMVISESAALDIYSLAIS